MASEQADRTLETMEYTLEWEQRSKQTPLWLHIVAGSVAGGFEKLVMYPADTVKTHMQSYDSII